MTTQEARKQKALDLLDKLNSKTYDEILNDDTLSESARAMALKEFSSSKSKISTDLVLKHNFQEDLLRLSHRLSQYAKSEELLRLSHKLSQYVRKEDLLMDLHKFHHDLEKLVSKEALHTKFQLLEKKYQEREIQLKQLLTSKFYDVFNTYRAVNSNAIANIHVLNEYAAADLQNKKGYACKMSATGINLCGDGEKCDGVLIVDTANTGMNAPITYCGEVSVMSGAAFTKGDYLTPDANGKLVTATTGKEIFARALADATAADEMIKAMIVRAGIAA